MPSPSIESVAVGAWPPLPLDGWRDTYATLHMWTQVVGKLALGLSPLTNHYWNTALQITPRGLATLPLPVGRRLVTVTFDFVSHQLGVESSDGGHTTVSLEPRPVAEFYRLVMDEAIELGHRPRLEGYRGVTAVRGLDAKLMRDEVERDRDEAPADRQRKRGEPARRYLQGRVPVMVRERRQGERDRKSTS